MTRKNNVCCCKIGYRIRDLKKDVCVFRGNCKRKDKKYCKYYKIMKGGEDND